MKKIYIYFIDIILLIGLIILDQYTKGLAVLKLKNKAPFVIINNVFEFYYLENRGAAFGMLQNQKFFFVFVAIIFLIIIAYVLIKCPNKKQYISLHILLTAISAGAIGNMIDRVLNNYVVDFLYLKLIDFPVFNVADIYVTVATFLLIILILFKYKDNDFDFISIKKSNIREKK